jgi:SAM-dependent methyltransferase
MPEHDTDATETERESENRATEPNADRAAGRGNSGGDPAADGWAERAWTSGSYRDIAPNYLGMAGTLVDHAGISAGDAVLDVGCGTGSAAITAARRDARVTGVDITPAMLERARDSAETAGVDVVWRNGDATDLPFEADAFDATLSNLGHMYGDPPDDAADELVRVTRSGGRIGFTAWTPTGVYPAMAGAVASVLPPSDLPDFSEPPFLWGDTGTVRERLGAAVEDLTFETRTARYPALSPEHFWEHTAANSGTFVEVLDRVADDERAELRERLVAAIEPYFDGRGNAVELEYLLATATVPK